jgi:hypothetical protein
MRVTIRVSPGSVGARGWGGAHLTWRLLLDRVFADAEAFGVDRLYIMVPDGALLPMLEVRADTRIDEADGLMDGERSAIAWLNGDFTTLIRADRVYALAPIEVACWSHRRQARRAGWRPLSTWYLPTWRAVLLGPVIRVMGRMRWAYWQDRALFAARRRFVQEPPTLARYVLTVWEPVRDPIPLGTITEVRRRTP